MKAVTPNPTHASGGSVYIELPCGERARVTVADYERHELGGYRWYIGARGAVVSNLASDRRTVYLARLLVGAGDGDKVSMIDKLPSDAGDGNGNAYDYRPTNFRTVSS